MYETLKFTEMTTRRVIDAKDKDGEKVYVKGHAKATYMSDGRTVDEAVNNKVDKVDGKQLSTEDFTTLLKQKLDGLSNYDDTEIQEAVSKLRTDLDTLVSGDTTTAIKTFNEVIAFLDGIQDTQDLSSIIASIEQQISAKGTYTKPSTGIPKSDFASAVQASLGKADTALQSEQYKGTVTSVKINGTTKTPDTSGMVDLGTIEGGGSSSGGESSNTRKEIVYLDMMDSTITSMRPDVVYWLADVRYITIDSFEEPLQDSDSYDIFTAVISLGHFGGDTTSVSLTLPDYVFWANGQMPDLTQGNFELSISRISDGYSYKYFAVLTPFKTIA